MVTKKSTQRVMGLWIFWWQLTIQSALPLSQRDKWDIIWDELIIGGNECLIALVQLMWWVPSTPLVQLPFIQPHSTPLRETTPPYIPSSLIALIHFSLFFCLLSYLFISLLPLSMILCYTFLQLSILALFCLTLLWYLSLRDLLRLSLFILFFLAFHNFVSFCFLFIFSLSFGLCCYLTNELI